MSQDNIYLKLNEDRTWAAVVATEKPSEEYVLFTGEGEYPTEVFYSRTDLNGSGVLCGDECVDRDSLLESLNWIGQCGYTVLNLWNYDIEYPWDAKIEVIFESAYERRYEMEQIASADYYEVSMEDCDLPSEKSISWSFRLDNGLLALVERNVPGASDKGDTGNVYDFNLWEPNKDGSRGKLYSGGDLSKKDDITSLSQAVKWVFDHYSRAALIGNEGKPKESLDAQIQSAQKQSDNSRAGKTAPYPQR